VTPEGPALATLAGPKGGAAWRMSRVGGAFADVRVPGNRRLGPRGRRAAGGRTVEGGDSSRSCVLGPVNR